MHSTNRKATKWILLIRLVHNFANEPFFSILNLWKYNLAYIASNIPIKSCFRQTDLFPVFSNAGKKVGQKQHFFQIATKVGKWTHLPIRQWTKVQHIGYCIWNSHKKLFLPKLIFRCLVIKAKNLEKTLFLNELLHNLVN